MGRPYRVLLTREDNRRTRELLESRGVEVVEVALVAFEPTGATLPAPSPHDVVAFTSVNGVRFGGRLALQVETVAAVGPATAEALVAWGRPPDLVPKRALGAALAEALGPEIAGRRVWLPRAEIVPLGLVERLRALGADPVPVPVYRTVLPPAARQALAGVGLVHAIAFASGSAVRHFFEAGGRPGAAAIVAIGPSTARVCAERGLEVAAVAEPHTAAGLAQAVVATRRCT